MTAPTCENTMASDTASMETLPPPPRPLTPRVRRRAWAEPHVRFWWIVAAVLVAAGVYMLVINYVAWRREVLLIRDGIPVKAYIERSASEVLGGRPVAPEMPVVASFEWQGDQHKSWGLLEGRTRNETILTKSTVTIRVDPKNPDRWTYRKEPRGLAADLLGAVLAFALVPPAMLAAVALRRGVLRTWRDGAAVEAVVIARHGSALAPRTRALRCVPADTAEEPEQAQLGQDSVSRVHTVYVPTRHSEARRDLLRVVLPPRGRGRPLAAAWFE
jgi:hypothetical protein